MERTTTLWDITFTVTGAAFMFVIGFGMALYVMAGH